MSNYTKVTKRWVAIHHDRGWTGYAGPFYSTRECNDYIEKAARGGIECGIVGFDIVNRRPTNDEAR